MYTLDPQEVHASDTTVIGTIFIDKLQARILFDSGVTHSFTSPYFINKLAREKTIMKVPLSYWNPIRVEYRGEICVPKMCDRDWKESIASRFD